jgi:hypothetical protein
MCWESEVIIYVHNLSLSYFPSFPSDIYYHIQVKVMNAERWLFQTLYSFHIITSFKFIDYLTADFRLSQWFIGDVDLSSEWKSEPSMKIMHDM